MGGCTYRYMRVHQEIIQKSQLLKTVFNDYTGFLIGFLKTEKNLMKSFWEFLCCVTGSNQFSSQNNQAILYELFGLWSGKLNEKIGSHKNSPCWLKPKERYLYQNYHGKY